MRHTSLLLAVALPLFCIGQLEVPVHVELDGAASSDRQILGLADPVDADAAASVDAVRSATMSTTEVTGTSALSGSLLPALPAYIPGMLFTITPDEANAPGATLELNDLGPMPIVKWGQLPLDSADLMPGMPARLVYDGTRFLLLNNAYRPCPAGYSASSAISCIADSVLSSANFHQATMACDAVGARLCSFGEWTSACRTKPGFLGSVTEYEWVGDGANSAADGKLVGAGSNGPTELPGIACEYGITSGNLAVRRFRCCLSR
jgi:hypothetical protein